MTNKMKNAFYKQINAEFEASYLYLQMSLKFKEKNLDGAANWFMIHSKEEYEHAMKFINHLLDRNQEVKLYDIKVHNIGDITLKKAFELALEHERKVGKMIKDLYELRIEEKDHESEGLIEWFLEEQIEEENIVTNILDKINLAGESGLATYLIDRELSQRTQS